MELAASRSDRWSGNKFWLLFILLPEFLVGRVVRLPFVPQNTVESPYARSVGWCSCGNAGMGRGVVDCGRGLCCDIFLLAGDKKHARCEKPSRATVHAVVPSLAPGKRLCVLDWRPCSGFC